MTSNLTKTTVEKNTEQFYTLKCGNGVEIVKDPVEAAVLACIAECKPENTRIGDYSWDTIGMSELFAKCYKDRLRYCDRAGFWYVYDGSRWKEDSGKNGVKISATVMQFIRLLGKYSYQFIGDNSKTAFIEKVSTFVRGQFRDRLIKDAAPQLNVEPQRFDSSAYLLNCTNGTYDLRTGEFRESRADDFITQKTNCIGSSTPLSFPRWERFINEVCENDKEKAAYLQRALGYSIFGKSNEECMFILYGKSTRNGKSTLLETLHYVLGDYADTAPVDLICKGGKLKSVENASPILAKLKGKRFVTMSEAEQNGKIDESVLKQYTGGEAITARPLYQKPFEFVPQFTLWLSCNDLPRVEDSSIFASERIRVIEFNRHFSNAEQNKNLKTEFRTPNAASAILQWLIAGYLEYKQNGLKEPASVKAATKRYEKDSNVILTFLDENYKPDSAGVVSTRELYNRYSNWCRVNGYTPASKNAFSRELSRCTEWNLTHTDTKPRGFRGLSPSRTIAI